MSPCPAAICREYADFRVGSDGELQGVGLLIASDPSSGRLVVLAPIKDSPAERAGIMPGDQVRPFGCGSAQRGEGLLSEWAGQLTAH